MVYGRFLGLPHFQVFEKIMYLGRWKQFFQIKQPNLDKSLEIDIGSFDDVGFWEYLEWLEENYKEEFRRLSP